MNLIQPFAALRPLVDKANQVIAPPYDVLTRCQALQLAENNPLSILHVTKPEIHFPEDFDPNAGEVYQQAAEYFARLQQQDLFVTETQPSYYIYRMQTATHSQTGIVAMASVAAYETQRVRCHEFTRPAKVTNRQKLLDSVGAQVSPVLLAYRDDENVDAVVVQLTESEPLYDVTAPDGVQHQIWPISSDDLIAHLTAAFDQMSHVYIADGHHRTQAAVQHAKQAENGDADPRFLCVLFPASQLRILGYHRVVRELNGLQPHTLLDRLSQQFKVTKQSSAVMPQVSQQFGLYCQKKWYQLTPKTPWAQLPDPIENLDVTYLHKTIIEPILGITDLSTDKQIDFVGGQDAADTIEQLVDDGIMQAGFTLYPTQPEQLLEVADAKQIMPTKSTWFEPKLIDGLLNVIV